ncbi:receptor-type tyrosine-protein phosphatase mu-like isoform X1 [Tachysurus ichikawai]
MMEFGHFISVTVELACRAPNDGDCNFEKPFGACGYSQGRDDDLEWEQVNTKEKPSANQWMPPGELYINSHNQTSFTTKITTHMHILLTAVH